MFHRGMIRHAKKKKSLLDQGRRTIDDMPFKDLVKVLDKEYSQYRRLKAALASHPRGVCVCATCGAHKLWDDIDLGHYITRAIYATRWDDLNTAPQCAKCNRYMNGMGHAMRDHLVKKHGEPAVIDIEIKAGMGGHMDPIEMREKIRYYRAEIKRLRGLL